MYSFPLPFRRPSSQPAHYYITLLPHTFPILSILIHPRIPSPFPFARTPSQAAARDLPQSQMNPAGKRSRAKIYAPKLAALLIVYALRPQPGSPTNGPDTNLNTNTQLFRSRPVIWLAEFQPSFLLLFLSLTLSLCLSCCPTKYCTD